MDLKAGGRSAVIPRVDILGVEVSAIDLDTAVETIGNWIDSDQREYVCVTGVHGVMESLNDPGLKEIHNRSGLTTPDGMPLVWCSHFAGAKDTTRVYGPDLMLRVCAASVERDWRHFFYGSAPGTADELARRVERRFEGLDVVGTYSPPYRDLTESEIEDVAQMLNDSDADIVWIGLSTPKQERLMDSLRPMVKASALIGVGAAFDIHAGNIKQAPQWMRGSGLEWLFRLTVEPRRLWRRYLRSNPRFVWSILRNRPRMVLTEGPKD